MRKMAKDLKPGDRVMRGPVDVIVSHLEFPRRTGFERTELSVIVHWDSSVFSATRWPLSAVVEVRR